MNISVTPWFGKVLVCMFTGFTIVDASHTHERYNTIPTVAD